MSRSAATFEPIGRVAAEVGRLEDGSAGLGAAEWLPGLLPPTVYEQWPRTAVVRAWCKSDE